MTSRALLGGSFDPIHNGHLHIARQILKAGVVSSFVFLPNARHHFKQDKVVLDYQHRLELVRSALEPGMEVWDDDAQGTGFTADLMQELYRKYPQDYFYFVIGSDNVAELSGWHDFPWLRRNVRFLIIPRPEYPLDSAILKRIKRKTLRMELSDVSSTRIRELISQGKSISGLVPSHLEQRILELYAPLLHKKI